MAVFIVIVLFILALIICPTLIEAQEKKREGYLIKLNGNVWGTGGVNFQDNVTLKLYSDKLTINDLATIRIKNITKVNFLKPVKSIRAGGGYGINRYFGELEINFIDKSGKQSYFYLTTPQKNMHSQILKYELAQQIIKKRIGLENNYVTTPTEPYEL